MSQHHWSADKWCRTTNGWAHSLVPIIAIMMIISIWLVSCVTLVYGTTISVDNMPVLVAQYAPEDIGNVQWFNGDGTRADPTYYPSNVPRASAKYGDDVTMACVDKPVSFPTPYCVVIDSVSWARLYFSADYQPSFTTGDMTVTYPFSIPSSANSLLIQPNTDQFVTVPSQGVILSRTHSSVATRSLSTILIGQATKAGSLYQSVDGDRTTAVLPSLRGLCTKDDNGFFVLDDNAVRYVDTTNIDAPTISRFAGSYTIGGNGTINGDALTTARFTSPNACAYSSSTNMLYIAESSSSTLRRINTVTMVVEAFSSTTPGYKDSSTSVLSAQFNSPSSLVIDDKAQLLYVSDTGNNVIRTIHLTTGVVETLAGDPLGGLNDGIGWDASFTGPTIISKALDHLYVYEPSLYRMRRVALPIEIITTSPIDNIISDVAYTVQVSLTRGCYDDMVMHVTTSGELTVNSVPSTSFVLDSGDYLVTMRLYYPANLIATITEWFNITLSGTCVTNGAIAVPYWNQLVTIYPTASVSINPATSSNYMNPNAVGVVSYTVNSLPSSVGESFTLNISAPHLKWTTPTLIEITPASSASGTAQYISSWSNAMVGVNEIAISIVNQGTKSYQLAPATSPTFTSLSWDWGIYASISSYNLVWNGTISSIYASLPLFDFPAPFQLIVTPHCDGGTFTPVSQTIVGGTSQVGAYWSFTAASTSGVFPITWSFAGNAASSMHNRHQLLNVIVTQPQLQVTVPSILTINTPTNLTFSIAPYVPLTPMTFQVVCSGLIMADTSVTFTPANNTVIVQVTTVATTGHYALNITAVDAATIPVSYPSSVDIHIVRSITITGYTTSTRGIGVYLTATISPPLVATDVTLSLLGSSFTFSPSFIMTFTPGTDHFNFFATPKSALGTGTFTFTYTATSSSSTEEVVVYPIGGTTVTVINTIEMTLVQSPIYAMIGVPITFVLNVAVGPIYTITVPVILTGTTFYGGGSPVFSPGYLQAAFNINAPTVAGSVVTVQFGTIMGGLDVANYRQPQQFSLTFQRGLYVPPTEQYKLTTQYFTDYPSPSFLLSSAGLPNGTDTVIYTCSNPDGYLSLTTTNITLTSASPPSGIPVAFELPWAFPSGAIAAIICNVTGGTAANLTSYVMNPSVITVHIDPKPTISIVWPTTATQAPGAPFLVTITLSAQPTSSVTITAGSCGTFASPVTFDFTSASLTTDVWMIIDPTWPSPTGGATPCIATAIITDPEYQYGTPVNQPTTIMIGASTWVTPLALTLPYREVIQPLQLSVGLAPIATGANTINDYVRIYFDWATTTPQLGVMQPNGTNTTITLEVPASTPPGSYVLGLATMSMGNMFTYPSTNSHLVIAPLTVLPLQLPASLIAGGVYGPITAQVSYLPDTNVTVHLDTTPGITCVPSSLTYLPTGDDAQTFYVYVDSTLPDTLADISITYSGADAHLYTISTLYTMHLETSIASLSMNISNYPVAPVAEGYSTKLRFTPVANISTLSSGASITISGASSSNWVISPSSIVIRSGSWTTGRRMMITAMVTNSATYSVPFIVSGTDSTSGVRYSYPITSQAIAINSLGRLQLVPFNTIEYVGKSTSMTATLLNRVLPLTDHSVTYICTSINDAFTFPAGTGTSFVLTWSNTDLSYSKILYALPHTNGTIECTASVTSVGGTDYSSQWVDLPSQSFTVMYPNTVTISDSSNGTVIKQVELYPSYTTNVTVSISMRSNLIFVVTLIPDTPLVTLSRASYQFGPSTDRPLLFDTLITANSSIAPGTVVNIFVSLTGPGARGYVANNLTVIIPSQLHSIYATAAAPLYVTDYYAMVGDTVTVSVNVSLDVMPPAGQSLTFVMKALCSNDACNGAYHGLFDVQSATSSYIIATQAITISAAIAMNEIIPMSIIMGGNGLGAYNQTIVWYPQPVYLHTFIHTVITVPSSIENITANDIGSMYLYDIRVAQFPLVDVSIEVIISQPLLVSLLSSSIITWTSASSVVTSSLAISSASINETIINTLLSEPVEVNVSFVISGTNRAAYSLSQSWTTFYVVPPIRASSSTGSDSSSSSTGVDGSSSTGVDDPSSLSSTSDSSSSSSSSSSSTWSSSGSSTSSSSSSSSTGAAMIASPKLLTSIFNGGGTRIILTFDIATNIAGTSLATSAITSGSSDVIMNNVIWPQQVNDCNTIIIMNVLTRASLGGTSVICQWSSIYSLEMILGINAIILPSDTISFRSNVIGNIATISSSSSATATSGYWNGGTISIGVPLSSSIVLPTVSLIAPNEIGVCSDLLLDGRQTTGLPRNIAIYHWNITSSSSLNGVDNIRMLLQSSNASLLSMITIPSAMLLAGESYTFTVSVTNFLGISSLVSSRTIMKSSIGLPLLSMVSGSSWIYRTSLTPLVLIPSLSFPSYISSCISLSSSWLYRWSITSITPSTSTSTSSSSSIGTTSVTPLVPSLGSSGVYSNVRSLTVLPKTLSAGFDYTFTVNASSTISSSSSSSPSSGNQAMVSLSYTVNVLRSLPIAIISGGNRLVSPNVTLIIDGSLSYDPDYNTDSISSSSSLLSFVWSCSSSSSSATSSSSSSSSSSATSTVSSSDSACGMITASSTSGGVSLTSSRLTIPSSLLLPSSLYVFTLSVISIDGTGASSAVNRSSLPVSVTIKTSESETSTGSGSGSGSSTVPIMGASIIIPAVTRALMIDGFISSSSIIRLQASVIIQSGSLIGYNPVISFDWREINQPANGVNSVDLTKRSSVMNSASLVLPANLLHDGTTYIFRVTASLIPLSTPFAQSVGSFNMLSSLASASSLPIVSTYADVMIQTSLPPLSSSSQPITISPSEGGIALSTIFTVSLNGFTGEMEPFTYSFKQLSSSNGGNDNGNINDEIIIGEGAVLSSSSTQTYLSEGNHTIIGYVINRAGQRTRVTTNVIVLPNTAITIGDSDSGVSTNCSMNIVAFAANITSTLLNDQILTGNTAASLDIVRLLTNLLTTIDIPMNCTLSNEMRASLIEQFLSVISSIVTSSPPEQISQVLETISQQLTNSTVIQTIDVIDQIISIILSNGGNGNGNGNGNNLNATSSSIVGTISNVLSSSASNNCSNIARVASSLTSVLEMSLTDAIPDELPITSISRQSNVGITGERVSSSSSSSSSSSTSSTVSVRSAAPSILVLGGSNVEISSEAVSSDASSTNDSSDNSDTSNDYVDIHVIQYVPTLASLLTCYSNNSSLNVTSDLLNNGSLPVDIPLGPITSIDLYDRNGSTIDVNNLTQPINWNNIITSSVTTILSFGSQSCPRKPVCSWFDESTNTWSSEGCTTISVTEANGGSGSSVACSCNHLTEFAILARDAVSCNGIMVYSDEKMVYGIYSILYAIVAVISLVQLSRVIIYTRMKCKFDLLAAEHVCVLIIAIMRAVLLLMRGQFGWSNIDISDMSLVALGLLTAIPYLFQFLAYTFLVATWASVYHFAMEKRGQSPFAKLRVPFIITNVIIGCVVFGLFGAIGGVHDTSTATTLSTIGTIIMAVLTIIMVAAYLVYGRALINTLSKTGGGTAAKSPVVRNLYYATAAFCICFAAEAIIWVVSAVVLDDLYDDAAGILGAYYGVNWLSLVIILAMFRNGVNKLSPSFGHSRASQTGSQTQRSHSVHKAINTRLTHDDGNKKRGMSTASSNGDDSHDEFGATATRPSHGASSIASSDDVHALPATSIELV